MGTPLQFPLFPLAHTPNVHTAEPFRSYRIILNYGGLGKYLAVRRDCVDARGVHDIERGGRTREGEAESGVQRLARGSCAARLIVFSTVCSLRVRCSRADFPCWITPQLNRVEVLWKSNTTNTGRPTTLPFFIYLELFISTCLAGMPA